MEEYCVCCVSPNGHYGTNEAPSSQWCSYKSSLVEAKLSAKHEATIRDLGPVVSPANARYFRDNLTR
jgi:hypothetical protein